MSTGKTRATWALLPPNGLPSAHHWRSLLGSVCVDFERPLNDAHIPEDGTSFLDVVEESKFDQTNDEGFSTLITSTLSKDAHARLADVLNFVFGKDIKHVQSLSSMKVRTRRLLSEPKHFKKIKRQSSNAILDMFNEPVAAKSHVVYMIVGVKTCWDAELHTEGEDSEQRAISVRVPISEVAAASGTPLPCEVDLEGEQRHSQTRHDDTTMKASGGRIFAIECRLIKRRRDWLTFSPVTPVLGMVHTPKTAFMGPQDPESDDNSSEDESPSDDDALQLGHRMLISHPHSGQPRKRSTYWTRLFVWYLTSDFDYMRRLGVVTLEACKDCPK